MRLTEKVHHILAEHLAAGDLAIDATAGNGHDTAFLAKQVGPEGRVIAIDIQDAAIQSTRNKLDAAQLTDRVDLRCADHGAELSQLALTLSERAAAIVFNLGYLPGSDKSVQTENSSTGQAMDASSALLRPQGLLCVTAYRGHPGGLDEARIVEDWMRTREANGWTVEYHEPAANNLPPVLWLARKP